MINEIYENIVIRDRIEERLHSLFEGKTWEQIALELYQILDDIDTADDMCKENVVAFRDMVMKLQAKKNQLLYSPDGYVVKRMDERLHRYNFHCNSCGWDDELKSERNPKFCPKCGSNDIDWYLLDESKLKEHLNDDGSGDTDDIDDVRPKKSRPPKKKKLTPEEWKKQYSDPIRHGGKESKLKEQDEDWDLTFKYTHNQIVSNPLIDKEGVAFHIYKQPFGIRDMKVRVFSDYQADWVERNGGDPVRVSESIKENLTDFARNELQIAGLFDKDSDYDGMLGEATIELINTFAKQGHSGFSAGLVRELFTKLSNYKPLTEISNNPDEWMNVDGKNTWQSRRNPTLFSNDEGKTYYDLDEIDENGNKVMHTSKDYE